MSRMGFSHAIAALLQFLGAGSPRGGAHVLGPLLDAAAPCLPLNPAEGSPLIPFWPAHARMILRLVHHEIVARWATGSPEERPRGLQRGLQAFIPPTQTP